MEQSVDQFYISLMSNASMDEYPENVLSAFTNKLAKPCRVNENWVVGVTEIFFNSFTAKSAQILASVDNVETFTPVVVKPQRRNKRKHREYVTRHDYQHLELVPNKKQKRAAQNERKLIIKAHPEFDIVLTHSDLSEMCYEKNDMNFGKFLEVLSEKIVRLDYVYENPETPLEDAKKQIKNEMMDIVKRVDWTRDLPETKYYITKNDYKLHVYMGSKQASIVALHLIQFFNMETFITDIIRQIPMKRRDTNNLLQLFDIFHSKYKLYNANPNEQPIDDSILKIQFNEYGVSTEINTQKLLQAKDYIAKEGVSLVEIIKLFKENLKFQDEAKLSEADKVELREKIANSVLDVLRGNKLDGPRIEKTLKPNTIPLNVSYKKDKFYRAVLEPKNYNRMEEFLDDVYKQVPIEDRDKNVFVETLFQAFDANADKKIGKRDMFVHIPPHLNSFPVNSPNLQPMGGNVYKVIPHVVDDTVTTQSYDQTTENKTSNLQPSGTQHAQTTDDKSITEIEAKKQVSEIASTEPQSVPISTHHPQTIDNKSSTKSEEKEQASETRFAAHPVIVTVHDLDNEKRPQQFVTPQSEAMSTASTAASFIYLYSDIIKSRFCTSQLVRALRIIPYAEMTQKRIEFRNVEYYPLERTNFDSISILITDAQGQRIPFKSSTTATYVQLHFKRV